MSKLYFGTRGGVYYRKKGRKVYVTNCFGNDHEREWTNVNNKLCNAILNRPPFQSFSPYYVEVNSSYVKYVKYDDYLKLLLKHFIELEYKITGILKSSVFSENKKLNYLEQHEYDETDKTDKMRNAIIDNIDGSTCQENSVLFDMIKNLPVKENIIVYQGAQMEDPYEDRRKWNSTSIYYKIAVDFMNNDAEINPVINIIVIPKNSHALYIDHYTDGDIGEVVLRNYKDCFEIIGQPFKMDRIMHRFIIYRDQI
jgi:hypothetical protein